jgi:hypothetical protein
MHIVLLLYCYLSLLFLLDLQLYINSASNKVLNFYELELAQSKTCTNQPDRNWCLPNEIDIYSDKNSSIIMIYDNFVHR